jgi:hypothetical protein
LPDPGNELPAVSSSNGWLLRASAGQCGDMSLLANKIANFLRGRNGRRLIEQAQRFAARPENQRRIAQLRERLAAQRQRRP